ADLVRGEDVEELARAGDAPVVLADDAVDTEHLSGAAFDERPELTDVRQPGRDREHAAALDAPRERDADGLRRAHRETREHDAADVDRRRALHLVDVQVELGSGALAIVPGVRVRRHPDLTRLRDGNDPAGIRER